MTDAVALADLPQIPDLSPQDQNTLDCLIRQFRAKWPRNELRARYYDHKNVLKDFGISIPPQLKGVETVVGWPEKAVDALARRIRHDGFVIPGGDAESLGINDMWAANRMDIEAPQAQTSALIHSCAFIATTLGDVASGEPEVLMTARSALSGTGIWDPRRRRLSSALSIVAYDESFPHDHRITELVMYLPDRVLIMTRNSQGKWTVDTRPHTLGRVPVELLVFRPRLDRSFGSSRITRAVMSITDEAVRTVLRTEVSAEFYSSPQRYMLGADPDAFVDAKGRVRTGWEAILGHMLAIGRDEDGNVPTVGQFPQMTMQPHIEHMRSIATRFSGATNLPVGALGVVQDNPSSAEAIYAAKEELITEAEYAGDVFGMGWTNAVRTGLMLRDKLTEAPPEWNRLRVNWRDPATPSRSAATDAVQKLVTAFPWLAESQVALEQLGWDETTIARAMADKRRSSVTALTQRLTAAQQPTPAPPVGTEAIDTGQAQP
ncbi:phage portal protein [Nocardia sp. NBC_01009]|uniref:phage portal protein n=1 Tax=Nocardia sp. NBC_01009 TaxID=2975996 RepID=UPI00386992F6|nr:phage portal protein [Nocardia sp. NBC_01009]